MNFVLLLSPVFEQRRSPRKYGAALSLSPEFERNDQMISVSQRRLSRGAEALTSRHHTSEVAQRLTLSPAAAELGSPIHDDSARISLFDAIYKDTGAPKQKIFKKGDVQTISAVLWLPAAVRLQGTQTRTPDAVPDSVDTTTAPNRPRTGHRRPRLAAPGRARRTAGPPRSPR